MQVAIMFVDIDNFKALNSTLSETVVDETVLPDFQRGRAAQKVDHSPLGK